MIQIVVGKRRSYIMTQALTGMFFAASIGCLALRVYKRMQCKKNAPQQADTDQPPHNEAPATN